MADGIESEPPPFDIFAGLKQQPLPAQNTLAETAQMPAPAGESKTSHVSQAHPELPLDRLMKRHPRLPWYIALVVAGIVLGVLLSKML
jgi:hypothetical protein